MENSFFLIREISKFYRPHWVLRDVGFSIRNGEVLGLIGPNGAGKTTLLECLAGLLPIDAGTIFYRERILTAQLRKSALFYLPDNIVPWESQSVKWAISFFGCLYSRNKTESDELIEILKLENLLTARIGTLSKGERKRLLLALGLLTAQPLLLLDEPFDGLDLRQTREVMGLLRNIAAGGRTMLLSIHQLNDAARVCDRLVLLSGGNCVGEGSLSELKTQANIAEGGLEEIFLALT